MAEINMNARYRSPYTVTWRAWMDTPCYLCGHEFALNEGRVADFIAQGVVCERCEHIDGQADG